MRRLVLPLILLTAGTAMADLDVSLSSYTEAGPPGGVSNALCTDGSVSCLIFSGTISDTDPDTSYFLLDIDLEFGAGDTWLSNGTCNTDPAICSNLFFSLEGPPGEFDPGDSYTGPIFEVDVVPVNPGDPATPAGVYNGTFTLLGNTDGSFDENQLVDGIPVQVRVTPEPVPLLLLIPGLGALILLRAKIRR